MESPLEFVRPSAYLSIRAQVVPNIFLQIYTDSSYNYWIYQEK